MAVTLLGGQKKKPRLGVLQLGVLQQPMDDKTRGKLLVSFCFPFPRKRGVATTPGACAASPDAHSKPQSKSHSQQSRRQGAVDGTRRIRRRKGSAPSQPALCL